MDSAEHHQEILEELVKTLEQRLEERNKQTEEEEENEFPFELVTHHTPSSSKTVLDRLFADQPSSMIVWVIDAFDPRFISKIFRFIRCHLVLDHKLKSLTSHLKSIWPFPHHHLLFESEVNSNRFSVLLAQERTISYGELTRKLMEEDDLRELIERETPYRMRVATRRGIHEGSKAGERERGGWPTIRLEEKTAERRLGTGTMQMNERMLARRWTAGEVRWLVTQTLGVAKQGLASRRDAGEFGVGAAVSRYALDVPDELGHLKIGRPSLRDNPILASAVDLRKSSGNRLRHAVVELTKTVSAADRIAPREPQSVCHPAPYLLTNQIVFLSHEPCLLCAMALLHSRIKHLFFLLPSPGSGGCGSVYHVHEQDGLNHKFFVWKLKLPHHLQNTFFDA